MEGLDAIKKRISADAREEAADILRQADKTIADLEKQNEASCRQILAEALEQSTAQAESLVSRTRSLAALDRRKTVLGARQDLIDQVLQRVLEILSDLPTAEKIRFYQCLVRQSGLTAGTIILAQADQALGSRLLSDGSHDLEIAAESGRFTGGLVISHDLIEENLTFETLILNNRPQWVSLAASVLFAQEVQPETQATGGSPL